MRNIQKHHPDVQQHPPAAYCSLCAGELYEGDVYWHINGSKICRACLGQFASEEFAAHREICGEEMIL